MLLLPFSLPAGDYWESSGPDGVPRLAGHPQLRGRWDPRADHHLAAWRRPRPTRGRPYCPAPGRFALLPADSAESAESGQRTVQLPGREQGWCGAEQAGSAHCHLWVFTFFNSAVFLSFLYSVGPSSTLSRPLFPPFLFLSWIYFSMYIRIALSRLISNFYACLVF